MGENGVKTKRGPGRRRIKNFDGGTVSVALSAAHRAALRREADRENLSEAEVMRRCLDKALPLLADVWRKKRRNAEAETAGK